MNSKMGYNCEFGKLVEDLVRMNVKEITMDDSGVLIGVVDLLREKGVKVNTLRELKRRAS